MPAFPFAMMLITVVAAAALSLLLASAVGLPFGLLGLAALFAAGVIRLRWVKGRAKGGASHDPR